MTPHERADRIAFDAAKGLIDMPELRATIESALREQIEVCAKAAEDIVPRHTECGNRIAAAIRELKK